MLREIFVVAKLRRIDGPKQMSATSMFILNAKLRLESKGRCVQPVSARKLEDNVPRSLFSGRALEKETHKY